MSYFWDGVKLIAEYKEGFGLKATYLYGVGGSQIHRKDALSGKIHYYFHNAHGDVTALTDGSGNVSTLYDYNAYGEVNVRGENIENPFKYFGQYYDEETGSYYLRARYYDPSMMRFTNEDTYQGDTRDPLSLNLYTYCYNNPSRYMDSSGNVPVETVIDIASIGWSSSDFFKNPSWANAGFLVWDVAAALLPYVPGSYVAKGAKLVGKADDVADVAQALSKANNIIEAADAFQKNKSSIIMSYKELKKTVKYLKISGLEVHHLIEKRFASKLGLNPDDMLSVALDKETHSKITKLMREKIGYALDWSKDVRTTNATAQDIWKATRETYTELGMTKYLDALKKSIIDAGQSSQITDWGEW